MGKPIIEHTKEQIDKAWTLCQKVFDFMDSEEKDPDIKGLSAELFALHISRAKKDVGVEKEIICMIGTERSDKEDD